MKKCILLPISFFFFVSYCVAQKSHIGITVGASFASYEVKIQSISVKSKLKPGFSAGITSSTPVGQHFSFMPALNFIQKGGTNKDNGASDKLTLNYLELPLNFIYNIQSPNGDFFAGAGPSLSFGLSGKDKDNSNGSSSSKITFGSGDDDQFKPFEVGANILAGYHLKGGFLVAANYNIGLNNISHLDVDLKATYHNRYFGIRLGYMFP